MSLWPLQLMGSARFVIPVMSCEVVVLLSCVQDAVAKKEKRFSCLPVIFFIKQLD